MDRNLESAVDEHVKQALEANHTDDGTGPEIVQQTIADTWAGTFLYQFFFEDASLRQSVIDFVCQHRPGENPRLGDPYKFGEHNYNIEILFDDGIALFRFPIPGVVIYPDDKVNAEVATMRYVAEHTAIPVPHIYHWGTAAENPTRLRVPFIIMDHIPHATTVAQALEDPDFTIQSIHDSEKREYLYQKMAEISLQLYSLTSDRIGSLGILENGGYAVTSAPNSFNTTYQAVNCSVPLAVLPPRGKTYSSSKDYFIDSANMEIAALLFMNERYIGSVSDCRDKFVARCLVRDLVRRSQNSTQTSGDVEAQIRQPRETFRLWGDDFRPENVLLNENGAVVGVVDWEYTYFAPETYSVNAPWWLPMRREDSYMDKGAESGPSDQEEPPHNVEKKKGEQTDEDSQEHWDELVRTYLRALEKAETELQNNQQVQPRGHHLCSRPNQDQPGPAPIGSHPLSQLMRHRWDDDRVEFALTTSLVQTMLLDFFFWAYIDEPCWGQNTVGRHEGRLGLLNAPCRMLMDWFVHRRVEERQKWDPKALLDQVLEHIEGKSSELAV